jgi:hypothetical protein
VTYGMFIQLALLLAICLATDSVDGRSRRTRKMPPPPKSYDRSCEGEVLGISDTAILMRQVDDRGSDYQPLIVIWPNTTTVRVTGEGDPSLLSKGQKIRFTSTIAAIQNSPVQLDRLEMLSPETDLVPGVETAVGGNPKDVATVIALVTSASRDRSSQRWSIAFSVPGNDMGIGRGRIWIPEDAAVQLSEFPDHRIVCLGDRIEVTGYVAGRPFSVQGFGFHRINHGEIIAEDVTIRLRNRARTPSRQSRAIPLRRTRPDQYSERFENRPIR